MKQLIVKAMKHLIRVRARGEGTSRVLDLEELLTPTEVARFAAEIWGHEQAWRLLLLAVDVVVSDEEFVRSL